MALHLSGQHLLLRLIAVFEEFLNHIITEHVCHQLARVRMQFSKYLILFVTIGRLKFLLDEAGAVLITAKLDDVFIDVLPQVSIHTLYITCPRSSPSVHIVYSSCCCS